jgi:hypothetical protein
MPTKKSISVVLLALFFVILGAGILSRRIYTARLFETAISPSSDTKTADAALVDLDKFKGHDATNFIYRIAVSKYPYIDDRQTLAIQLISQRGDIDSIAELSDLLQPQIDLARREAVASALKENACNVQCVKNVLHYEERLLYEKDPIEEALIGSTDERVNSKLLTRHASMIDALNLTLSRNLSTTVQVLSDTYGLGSEVPSSFALHIVDALDLRSACPLVSRSRSRLIDPSQKEAIESLLVKLNCGSGSPASPR